MPEPRVQLVGFVFHVSVNVEDDYGNREVPSQQVTILRGHSDVVLLIRS
jgi:hypothetical protein